MASSFESPSNQSDSPLLWKLTPEELFSMTPEQRVAYLNEKANRIYDALMLQAEAELSGDEIRPEDIISTLHPERKDEFDRLRNRDLPEH